MATLVWAMLCESSLIDIESNNVSLINVLEQFNPPDLPAIVQIPTTLVTHWKRETPEDHGPEVFRHRLVFENPEGARSESDWMENEIPGGRFRSRTRLGAMQLTIPGLYRILVEIQRGEAVESAGEVEFDVTEPQAR